MSYIMSVCAYYIIEYEVRDRSSNERPLLALVMIVKDEAHTLPNTLISIKPYLDYYYILDTGSKDGTQDAIRRTLGPKGKIFEVLPHMNMLIDDDNITHTLIHWLNDI